MKVLPQKGVQVSHHLANSCYFQYQYQEIKLIEKEMLGISYNTVQVFEYKDKVEMEKIHQFDDIQDIQFTEEINVVQYTFDRRKYIRLSDLVFWIVFYISNKQSDFIRFHHAQFLILLSQLITKVENMKDQNIYHGFLTTDRIWLCLEEESSCLSIIYKPISYSIVFTGYQHPLFEECISHPQPDDQRTKNIIEIMIISCMNVLKVQNNDDKLKQQKIKEIYNKLLEKIHTDTLIQVKIFIQQILADENLDPKLQIISFDETQLDGLNSIRGSLIQSVTQHLAQIINRYKFNHQLLLENVISNAIKNISQQINAKKSFQKNLINEARIQQEFKEKMQKIQNQIEQQDIPLKAYLNQSIINHSKNFKLEIQEYQKTIFSAIQQSMRTDIRFQYIYNSRQIIVNDSIENLIIKISQSIMIPKVDDEVKGFLDLEILKMLEGLI